MKRTVVIHQPDFAPYLGFFHRFLNADLYIALDHVQFVNSSSRAWTHRDKIKTAHGERWLSLSVKKAPRDTPINRIELSAATDWRSANLHQIQDAYRRASYYSETIQPVQQLYSTPAQRLVDFNLRSIEMLMDLFDVRVPYVLSSNLGPKGNKNEMLVDLLHKVGATHYLSGIGARDYFDAAPFTAAGIGVIWQEFRHPAYTQLHGEFIPFLSALDLLFNCGVTDSRRILRGIP